MLALARFIFVFGYVKQEEYLSCKNLSFKCNIVTLKELYDAIDSLDNNKSPGPGVFNAWAIKAAKFAIGTHLQSVFNTCISQNIFPEKLKLAFISPVYKKGDVKICENYRPISITPMFAKLFERILLNQVNEFMQKEKILNGTQFGFQKHKSSTDAVLHLIEALQENYDNLKISLAVFIDLAKAFNSISHEIFLKKIEAYGFSESAVDLFASFLKNRQQCVKINDVYSEWLETILGVPQGTVLGPLVFLLYINDFREKVQGNFDIIQFADDTCFHFSRNNVSELEKSVSEILEKTDNYLKENKLTMNTGKTEILCVSKENEKFNPIVYRGQEIKPQNHCRYLGIMIDSKLNFHVQLNKVLSNMATAIRSIYLIRYRLPLKARLMLFKSLVLSHLTFSALFFQNLKFSENAAN